LAETGDREAVSVRAVAQRVGVTSPSIYRHFKDKEDLLDAVCSEVFGALAVALGEAAAGRPTPMEKLEAQGRAYVRFALDNPEEYRMVFLGAAQPKNADQVLTDTCFQQLLDTVQECIGAGLFPSGPGGPVAIGLRLFAVAHGLASLLVTKPWLPWGDVDDVVGRTVRAAIAGEALEDELAGVPAARGAAALASARRALSSRAAWG
jgi:AcrR family transcriptional regulator